MHRWTKILTLGLLISLIVPAIALSQTGPGSEKELLAEREYEEGERRNAEALAVANIEAWEQTEQRLRDASMHFSKARDLYRELGKADREAACLAKMGQMENSLNNGVKAVEYFQAAANLFASVNNLKQVGLQKLRIGKIYAANKKCGPAKVNFYDALTLSRSVRDPVVEEAALSGIGHCFSDVGDAEKAIEYWSMAANVAEKSGDVLRRAENHRLLGGAYNAIGQFQRALTFYSTATELVRNVDGQPAAVTRGHALQGSASVMAKLGETRKSIELELAAIEVLDDFPAQMARVGIWLLRVSEAYGALGDSVAALKYCQQAFDIFHARKDLFGEADALRLFGQIYRYNFKNYAKSQKFYEQALAIATEIKNPSLQATVVSVLGDLADDQGNVQKRIEYKRKAKQFYVEAKDIRGVAKMLFDLGLAYHTSGDTKASTDSLSSALLYFAYFKMGTDVAETFEWLAIVRRNTGNLKLATAYAKQAVITLHRQRSTIATLDTATQRSYLKRIEIHYRMLAALLIRQRRLQEAHQVLTVFKDEQLLDVADKPSDTAVGANISLTAREQRLLSIYDAAIDETYKVRDRIDELGRLSIGGSMTPEQKAESDQLSRRMGTAFQNLIDTVEGKVGEFSNPADKDDELPDTDEIRSMWKALATVSESTGEPTVAIYQLAVPEGVDLLLVTPGEIKYVGSATKDLNLKSRTFWALLQSERYDPRVVGKELYDLVFMPLEKLIPANTKTILWSLDGNLRYVPMAALFDGERYLVERFNHVTLTRSNTARLTAPVSAKWTATGFGSSKARSVKNFDRTIAFSALPGVGTELSSLFTLPKRKLLDGELLLDESFTQKNMLEKLAAKRPVVHIASHFSFQAGDDNRSFLVLGDGTAFTLADMKKRKDMFAGVELLTLSACNTAAQQPDSNGREVDAFFELAQRLGAQSVLATLWPVADNSTPWLMREFYDLKIRKQENKAAAIRNAQLALLNGSAVAAKSKTRADASQVKIVVVPDGTTRTDTRADEFVIENKDAKPFRADGARPFSHPYFWSPFVLVGNWR